MRHYVVSNPLPRRRPVPGSSRRRANGESRMTDSGSLIEQAPIQDRDLLQRMSLYFDTVEHRLRHGEGWLIFNAGHRRAQRIAGFIQHRLTEHTPPVSYFVMPWRG